MKIKSDCPNFSIDFTNCETYFHKPRVGGSFITIRFRHAEFGIVNLKLSIDNGRFADLMKAKFFRKLTEGVKVV